MLACSKKAGILADLVAESPGALPWYISESLESAQNFLSKYLSVAPYCSGCNTQLIVAFLSLSNDGDQVRLSSLQTTLLVAT